MTRTPSPAIDRLSVSVKPCSLQYVWKEIAVWRKRVVCACVCVGVLEEGGGTRKRDRYYFQYDILEAYDTHDTQIGDICETRTHTWT